MVLPCPPQIMHVRLPAGDSLCPALQLQGELLSSAKARHEHQLSARNFDVTLTPETHKKPPQELQSSDNG